MVIPLPVVHDIPNYKTENVLRHKMKIISQHPKDVPQNLVSDFKLLATRIIFVRKACLNVIKQVVNIEIVFLWCTYIYRSLPRCFNHFLQSYKEKPTRSTRYVVVLTFIVSTICFPIQVVATFFVKHVSLKVVAIVVLFYLRVIE